MRIETILVRLSRNRIRYLVAGGVGVVLSGYPRLTADLDILVDLSPLNLGKCLALMKRLRYRPRLPVPPADLLDPAKREMWRTQKNLQAFTFLCDESPLEDVDLLIFSGIDFSRAWKRRQTVRVGGVTVPVASVEDLITMKRKAWNERRRPQDLTDVQALEAILSRGDPR